MAKNWTKIETVNDIPKSIKKDINKEKTFKVLINNTKSLSIEQLKKKSNDLYNKEKDKEDNLLNALNDNKLKSKNLIKKAIRIKKEREKAAIKASKNAKQKTENVSNEITEKAV